jgi:Transcription factor WhiB.
MNAYSGSIPDTLTRPGEWLATAPCKDDPDAMFPSTNPREIERAKGFCGRCPAVKLCLRWALDTGEEHGVWGGLTDQERRKLRRRAAQPINIDDYAGTRKTRQTATTLQDAWDANTLADGEHLLWTGPKVINIPRTKTQVTPNRLAFYLDRGRWPEGDTKRGCGVHGCVKPAHLTDRTERVEESELAVAV